MNDAAVPGLTVEALNANLSGFSAALGLVYDEVTTERLVAHVDCGPQHHQPYGLVHGGVWAAIVEDVGSVAAGVNVVAQGGRVVGVANSTDFLRAHREGRVEAVATPIHRGRTQHLWQVVMTAVDAGKVVARGQLRLAVLPGDREVAGRVLDAGEG